ncbi:hypothetical protein H9X86_05125 [Pseudoflavonifractor capillosus]|uniref:hypothetical protein n=1 Tax=Pseudoflavonifractor capillosus TaxID=106588 RepID=UPI0019565108|nr:hypothetical protein [Pseudoflavonifractor capillosus]MBM6896754.1 hypothetical protein [Pseudoflavonifractor capillosus]
MIGKLILWACIVPLIPLMYWQLNNETKFKKNIALGVTLPYVGRTHPQTVELLSQFRKALKWVCLGLLVSAVVLVLLPVSFGLSLTIWLVWLDVAIVVPVIPYVKYHKKLKALKKEQGWFPEVPRTRVVNLTAAAQEEKPVSPVQFLLPLAVSLVPLVWGVAQKDWLMAAMFLVGPVCVLLFWAMYQWAMRRRAETVDGNETLTQTLTRIRRRAWRRSWVWGSWFMAGVNLSMWLALFQPLWGLMAMLGLSVLFVVFVVGLEVHLRHQQEYLTAQCGQDSYVDEDEKWIWGMFYYDPHDTHLVVNARIGMNTTVNLAKKSGRIIVGVTAVLMLLMPLMGVWVMAEERAPLTLALTDTALVAEHGWDDYEIPLADLEQVELLQELPKGLQRVAGTGMDTVQKGRYRSDDYPKLTVCINPQVGPWLLITMDDGTVYLVGDGQGNVEDIFEQLQQ